MKKLYLTLAMLQAITAAFAKTPGDTSAPLIPQKENVITTSTIIKVENLGLNINSELAELRPTISPDGKRLFFICENHPYNTKYRSVPNSQDIWYAEKDSAGNWSEAIHLETPFNTIHYNAVYWISPDNNRIMIRGAFRQGAYLGKGVSITQAQKDGSWSQPEMLVIKNYYKYDQGMVSGATMAPNGKALLFYMSTEKNSYNNDIFVSFPQKDGSWTEPKSLGKKINLPDHDEMTPFMAADGVTLYFSSNRPGGMGDNDIWMTKRLDESWQKWSDPVNLGEPINTADWDAFFNTDAGGEYAYLSSSRQSYGQSDIVKVQLFEEKKPDPVVLVSGNVYNAKTREPLSAGLVYQTLPDGEVAGTGISNPADGAFNIVLPYNKNYSIRAAADKFFAVSENLALDSLVKQGYREIHKDLYLVPIEIGQVFRLNNVFFDFDKYDLRPESFVELNRVVDLLKENPAIEIEMSAHTDSRGSDEYNIVLSDNRARSVMNYLLSKGIAPSRVTSKGYGETRPVVPNDTDENRQLNRRVEFTIVKN